jgi:DNA-directed RNA polymerase specialized sigma24 family protein
MDVPVGTLTSRLSRGREALAAQLGGEESSS